MTPPDHEPDHRPDEAALLQRVESMIAAAGGYVDASDDLRPRVIEAARSNQNTERVRGRVGVLACAVLLVAVTGGVIGERLGRSLATASPENRVAVYQTDLDTAAAQRGGIDLCWRLVDAFVAVREEQASALRADREPPAEGQSGEKAVADAQIDAARPSF